MLFQKFSGSSAPASWAGLLENEKALTIQWLLANLGILTFIFNEH